MDQAKCLLCEQEGNSRVGAKHVPGYDFDVCWKHWEENWDGWERRYEKVILEHLAEKGIPVPRRDKNGLLPRDDEGQGLAADCL